MIRNKLRRRKASRGLMRLLMEIRLHGPSRGVKRSVVGEKVVGEHIACGDLLDGDHGTQHLCLIPVVLCLRGIVDCGKLRLALQAVCK
jgi:hypothetical protein